MIKRLVLSYHRWEYKQYQKFKRKVSMRLEEFFKENPELLKNKEVKEFILFVEKAFVKNAEIARRCQKESFEINDVIMKSNRVLINGYSDKDLVDKIEQILNSNPSL